jgi:hypothetical protein
MSAPITFILILAIIVLFYQSAKVLIEMLKEGCLMIVSLALIIITIALALFADLILSS